MNQSPVRILGHDIWQCDAPEGVEEALAGRHRFLNELWLPCPLNELSEEQIFVINRHRERVILEEEQYAFAARARNALAAVASSISAQSVMEVGCGKFPIEVEAEYLGVDIDVEAISALVDRGIAACHPDALGTNVTFTADLVVSAYAMHFPISDESIAKLGRSTTTDAIFCFNMIIDDPVAPLALMARLAAEWPFSRVVKTPQMARREFFLVMAREAGCSRIADASSAIQHSLSV